jgi:hypothetical protein
MSDCPLARGDAGVKIKLDYGSLRGLGAEVAGKPGVGESGHVGEILSLCFSTCFSTGGVGVPVPVDVGPSDFDFTRVNRRHPRSRRWASEKTERLGRAASV